MCQQASQHHGANLRVGLPNELAPPNDLSSPEAALDLAPAWGPADLRVGSLYALGLVMAPAAWGVSVPSSSLSPSSPYDVPAVMAGSCEELRSSSAFLASHSFGGEGRARPSLA